MEYIVKLSRKLTYSTRQEISKFGEITYESKFLPLIGLSTLSPDHITSLSYVESLRAPIEGEYQEGEFLSTLIFEPAIRKRVLTNNQLVGWGDTRIAVLDSGISSDTTAECIDFTNTGHLDTKKHGEDVIRIVKHFAKGCNLYSAKVGSVRPNELYVMKGLEWAAEKGVNIINISAGFKNNCNNGDCDLCLLVNEISKSGIAIVVAAGNNDNAENSIECPGIASLAVTVGAVNGNYQIASYSSFGKPGGDKPNLVASGTVYIDGRQRNGTSFAAPIITGVLGAILHRVGTVSTAVEYIYNTLADLNIPRHQQGLGLLNLEKLVEVVLHETAHFESTGQDQSS